MSCNREFETKCREHVLSLQPTPGEAHEFRKLNSGLLAADASWPPLLTNYLHRYMHSYNLYQISKSKNCEKLSNLVAFLGSRAELFGADILMKLTQKCTSLIVASARQWKQDRLLVSGGPYLRKSKIFKQAWRLHSDSFGREFRDHCGSAGILDSTSTGLPLSAGSCKRVTDDLVRGDVKKICKGQEPTLSSLVIEDAKPNPDGVHSVDKREMAGSSHASQFSQADDLVPGDVKKICRDQEPMLSSLIIKEKLNPDGVHSVDKREMARSRHASQYSQTDDAHDTTVVEHAADHPTYPVLACDSPIQPSENRSDISGNERLVHTAQESLGAVQQIERRRQTLPQVIDLTVQPRTLYSPSPRPPQDTGLAASLEHAVDTCPEWAFGANQSRLLEEGQVALRRLKSLGQLLIQRRGESGVWSIDVNNLILQDSNKFCDYIARITGLPKVLELSFEMLDLNLNHPYVILKGDLQAFHSLKIAILNRLLVLLDANPRLASFRILVTVPHRPLHTTVSVLTPLQLDFTPPSQLPAMEKPPASLNSSPPRCHPLADHGNNSLSHLSKRGSSCGSPGSQTQIVVRIQQTSRGAFSPRYQRAILGPRITNESFFAWIAKKISHHDPLGPLELEFCFKDALPPKSTIIARGDEEHFDYMKRDTNHICKQTAAQMPGLAEFTILVMLPRRTGFT